MVVASLAALELVNGGTVNLDILVKSPKLSSLDNRRLLGVNT